MQGSRKKCSCIPGFYVQPRTLRKYSKPVAAHLLGYVSEVDEALIKKDPYYKPGDYIGKLGIEEAYEKELRGNAGVKIYHGDVYSRIKGSYAEGRHGYRWLFRDRILFQPLTLICRNMAKNLCRIKQEVLWLSNRKQEKYLHLFHLLIMIPGLLVGRIRSENFARLQADTAI